MNNLQQKEKDILSKFSSEFIEKYRLHCTTNKVLISLIHGADVYKTLESVLIFLEDQAIDIVNKELIKLACGPRPQIICMTQEAIDSFNADREEKSLAAIKEAFPFEDETKPGRWRNSDNTDFRDL